MGDTTEADRRDQIEQGQGESTPGQRGMQTEQQGRQKKWILTGRTSARAQVAVDWPTKKSKHGREKSNPQGHAPPGHTPVRQKTLDPPGDSLWEQNHKMDFEKKNNRHMTRYKGRFSHCNSNKVSHLNHRGLRPPSLF
jgi:hypothetical protein